MASAKAYAPQARIIGVPVLEMVGEGVELITDVSCPATRNWVRLDSAPRGSVAESR